MNRKLVLFGSIFLFVLGLSACSDNTKQPVAPSGDPGKTIPACADFPKVLPPGVSIDDVKKSLESKTDVPFERLVPEVLEVLSGSYSPEEYYINSSGLHWGHPKMANPHASSAASGSCYYPYGFSLVGGFHFAYWFPYRPASYNAYMAWIPIYAEPYGVNGILVQKRDICWICGCNPVCAYFWTSICAK